MRFGYSREYLPPAPMMEIRLALPGTAFAGAPLTALLDTGADATIVPVRHIESLGAEVAALRYLRSP